MVIEAWDRDGLLRDVAIAMTEERVNMTAVRAQVHADGRATLTATLRIAGIDQLSRAFGRIERRQRRAGSATAGPKEPAEQTA